MRNKSKRFLSLLLAFCLTLTMSAPAFAAEDAAGDGQTAVTDQPDASADPTPAEPDAPTDGETGGQIDGETPQDPPAEGETGTEETPSDTPAEGAEEIPAETPDEAPVEEPLVLGADQLAVEAATEWSAVADDKWYNDTDTTFTLTTAEQLAGLARLVNAGKTFAGKTIVLGNDIDLTGKAWTVIGIGVANGLADISKAYCGVFDGADYTITGLSVENNTTGYAGLFGVIGGGAVIENLNITVDKVSTSMPSNYAMGGGVVGMIANTGSGGSIQNCHVTVDGDINVVSGNSHASAGGLVGVAWLPGDKFSITDCFVDVSRDATIYSHGTNQYSNTGGYVGYGKSTIKRSRAYVEGTLIGNSTSKQGPAVGGFIGNPTTYVSLEDCYAILTKTAKITAETSSATTLAGMGTLCGFTASEPGTAPSYKNCYVIDESTHVMGTAGSNLGHGALLGNATNLAITLTNCYYYTTTSGLSAVGANSSKVITSGGGVVNSVKDMAKQSTFAGFDFAKTWIIDAARGYPVIGTEVDLTPQQIVEMVKNNLTFEVIRGDNTSSNAVGTDLALPTEGIQGTSISWSSSLPAAISTTGKVVLTDSAQAVTLTATITNGNATDSKEIQLYTQPKAGIAEWSSVADTTWYNGTNTSFTLTSAEQLAGLAQLVNGGNTFAGKTIRLANNIDLSGMGWTVIGLGVANQTASLTKAFCGVFDGAEYTITGLSVENNTTGYAGLFGVIGGGAVIENLNITVDKVSTSMPSNYAMGGGVVGMIANTGSGGSIQNCYVTVDGKINVVSGNAHASAGGLVGVAWLPGDKFSITDCFVDVSRNATIYSHGTNQYSNTGGYVGYGKSTIKRSRAYVEGTLIGNSTSKIGPAVGGFIGNPTTYVSLEDCYAILTKTAKITAETSSATTLAGMGTLCGFTAGESGTAPSYKNCYVIDESTHVMGTAGSNLGHGALLGNATNLAITLTNCYYYTTTSGLSAVGANSSKVITSGGGAVSDVNDMAQQSTFVGFDFAKTWIMDTKRGYPIIGTEAEMTPEQIVEAVKQNLTWDIIKGTNTSQSAVKSKLNLITSGVKGATITWASSNSAVISSAGNVTPASEMTSTNVTLTATIHSGDISDQVTFDVVVPPSFNWGAFWKTYWDNPAHDDVVIDTVGDSITSGNLDYTKGYKFYYEWMQTRLNGEMGKRTTIVNPAISGWRMDQFNGATEQWVTDYQPDIVTVYFGMNDRSTDTAVFQTNFKAMMEKIVPSPENIKSGVPQDRVIVLISCNPTGNNADLKLREEHAYGEALSQEYQDLGYPVQYIDLYDYYKNQLQYGVDGNLSNFNAYQIDSLHMNGFGNYATAQFLMKNMGMYSEDSAICNIAHNTLLTTPAAPAASIDYTKAAKGLNDTTLNGAISTSPGYATMASAQAYNSMLMLGGAATSGTVGQLNEHRTYSWHIESYLRWVQGRSYRHGITIAGADPDAYSPQWFADHFDELYTRYDSPLFVMYMPEINDLYTNNNPSVTSKQLSDYKAGLEALVAKCKAKNVELTLLTPFPMQNGAKNKILEQYVQQIIDVANDKQVSISNTYSALAQVMRTPQGMRNWYDESGYPNGIAHIEAAKTFLSGTCGQSNTKLFQYTYRNATLSGGTQYDNYAVTPVYVDSTKTMAQVRLANVLADPLYSNMGALTTSNVVLEKNGTAMATTLDADAQTLSFSVADLGSDSARLKLVNGATTYLNVFTSADIIPALGGTVTINGTAKFGQTLSVNAAAVTPSDATYTYAWYRGETKVGTDNADYVLTAEDVGSVITLKLTGTGKVEGELTASTAVVERADGPAAPAAPTVKEKTDTTITLNAVAGQEYRLGTAGTWQTSGVFSNLTAGTEYSLYARIAQTDTHKASAESAALTVSTYTYSIEVDKKEEVKLTATVGYTSHDGAVITIKNSGTGEVTGLQAALSGTNAASFTTTALSATTLAAGASATFSVKPQLGLTAGNYSATVTVTGSGGTSASFAVAFAVAEPVPTGVKVSGTISSYNARNGATLKLYKQENGAYSETAAATTTIAAAETTTGGRAENAFAFSTVEPGTYKLVVEKAGHQSYVLEGIAVADTDVTLANTLKLLCGDVNGDGYIDLRDRELVNTAMFTLLLESRTAADLNGDGLVNFLDLNILMQTEHFNQQPKIYQAA